MEAGGYEVSVRVVVTGATGNVGTATVACLAATGHDVVGLGVVGPTRR